MSPTTSPFTLDWSELAFGSKKPLRDLKAIYLAPPREVSSERFTQLIKQYLPQGNMVLGLAKEDYIEGFAGQPHFRTLKLNESLQKTINQVNSAGVKHRIYILQQFQRETKHIIEKAGFQKVLFVNGSWRYAFHNREVYYLLVNQRIPYELISPFTSEAEAQAYEKRFAPQIKHACWPENISGIFAEDVMLRLTRQAAAFSYDYTFQTGVVLGKPAKEPGKYTFITYAYNRVVPFQTFALQYGASRERHFSPPHDLNHYDTVHAEVELIIQAQKEQLDLKSTTMFINLLPCPPCSRMLSRTDIREFVYSEDHSGGYAVELLKKAGKRVRRVVVDEL